VFERTVNRLWTFRMRAIAAFIVLVVLIKDLPLTSCSSK
jgi:hypothetical protein